MSDICAVKLGRKGGKASSRKKVGIHSASYKLKRSKKARAKVKLKKTAAGKKVGVKARAAKRKTTKRRKK